MPEVNGKSWRPDCGAFRACPAECGRKIGTCARQSLCLCQPSGACHTWGVAIVRLTPPQVGFPSAGEPTQLAARKDLPCPSDMTDANHQVASLILRRRSPRVEPAGRGTCPAFAERVAEVKPRANTEPLTAPCPDSRDVELDYAVTQVPAVCRIRTPSPERRHE